MHLESGKEYSIFLSYKIFVKLFEFMFFKYSTIIEHLLNKEIEK